MTITEAIGTAALNTVKEELAAQSFITWNHPMISFVLSHWVVFLIITILALWYLKKKLDNLVEWAGDLLLIWPGRAAILAFLLLSLKAILTR